MDHRTFGPGTPGKFNLPSSVHGAWVALAVGLLLAACADGGVAPSMPNPDPAPAPFVVGDVGAPNVEVRIPEDGDIVFEVLTEEESRLVEALEIDLDGDGEANLVVTRLRLSRYGEQLVTLHTLPGTFLAVMADGSESPPPDFGFDEAPPLQLPRIFTPGEVAGGLGEVWAETNQLYLAYVIRNAAWSPSGVRLLDGGNYLAFRIGRRLGWVEIAVGMDQALQVTGVEVLRVGLRIDPEAR